MTAAACLSPPPAGHVPPLPAAVVWAELGGHLGEETRGWLPLGLGQSPRTEMRGQKLEKLVSQRAVHHGERVTRRPREGVRSPHPTGPASAEWLHRPPPTKTGGRESLRTWASCGGGRGQDAAWPGLQNRTIPHTRSSSVMKSPATGPARRGRALGQTAVLGKRDCPKGVGERFPEDSSDA